MMQHATLAATQLPAARPHAPTAGRGATSSVVRSQANGLRANGLRANGRRANSRRANSHRANSRRANGRRANRRRVNDRWANGRRVDGRSNSAIGTLAVGPAMRRGFNSLGGGMRRSMPLSTWSCANSDRAGQDMIQAYLVGP
jgi:hypothetical protein